MERKDMNKLTRYRFEATVQDANEFNKAYLTNEFVDILESNKPYQSKCDYIGYSLLSIDEKINLIDEEMQNLKDYKQKLKVAKEVALSVGAKVFQNYGITKIEGARISSITVTNATETTKLELTVKNEEALIEQGFYKKVLDESKVLQSYVNGDFKEFIEEYVDVKPVIHIRPSKLRVNKRRDANHSNFDSNNISDVA
ncbi:hypothetical protein ACN9K5_09760 [Aliarcobacter butzleri]|uniref:hypothetical protein n=1 Tax=Aliarcobacter butzleri TaxID=28197 RepID=UPI003B21E467